MSESSMDLSNVGFASASDVSVQFSGTNFTTGGGMVSVDSATNGLMATPAPTMFTQIKLINSSTNQALDTFYAATSFRGTQAVFSDPNALDSWMVSKLTQYSDVNVEVSVNIPEPTIRKANIYSTQSASIDGFSLKVGSDTVASANMSVNEY
ncbi:hypothetical protein [Alteromonas macleodii]|uniref:hypothetical protein n=1 Tax=Alteromonas macleodii TaxID=28108 RepID=UPI0012D3393A|nr:hypothetical protein [Alteromonas macleodii]